MASMIFLPFLLYLPLLLLLPQLSDPSAIPEPKQNLTLNMKPEPSSTYIVHVHHLAKPSHFATLGHWYTSMVATHSPRPVADHSSRILYTYDTVMHGFAVKLNGDEAQRMSDAVGVIGLYEDKPPLRLLTTRSPGFLGLDPQFGAWRNTDSGDGVIIGFVDSGIWPESPSFNDSGLGPVRPSWRGKCVDAGNFNASLCNNKLVGTKAFDIAGKGGSGFVLSPRDYDGHGTHVAFDSRWLGGPESSTVTNAAPWVTTVGASTVDRLFPEKLNLGDGTVLTGQSLYTIKANGTNKVPLVINSCLKQTLTPDHIMGKIVVCISSILDEGEGEGEVEDDQGVDIVEIVQSAGGAGIVSVLMSSWSPDETLADTSTFPCLGLGYAAGKKLRAYMASEPHPVASLSFTCETVISETRAPMVASFSSRGPNLVAPELLKPDVIAPGVNILAAWRGNASLSNPMNSSYQLNYGTSMATPHVAGVAALIKKKHSDWTPAMIRSALITTAATLDNTGRGILDNALVDPSDNAKVSAATPFAAGAGHVRPQLAMDPGLVYDAGARDFVDFLCALNYTTEQIRQFAPDMATCTRELPGGAAGLNYPSFVVVFDGRTDVRTLTRTVTKVSQEAERYQVNVSAPEHVNVTVTPATLEFKEQYEKRSYTVEFGSKATSPEWEFGHIIWENEKHRVRSPVAFTWKTNN
nr:unnamed protein product [Digitaria exilis]